MTTWHVYHNGVHIWLNGTLVKVIPFDQFPALIADCARELQAAAGANPVPKERTFDAR